MNQFYNIWNHDYIQQQAQTEHHYSQIKQVQDTVKALNDFLDGLDKIEPAYQNVANVEFCSILAAYFNRHNRR